MVGYLVRPIRFIDLFIDKKEEVLYMYPVVGLAQLQCLSRLTQFFFLKLSSELRLLHCMFM